MSKLPLSVTIITLNEEKRLPFTLESIKDWVGEVIVVDSGSTDATVEIAKQYGAFVYTQKWEGYGLQKRYAEKHAQYEWILNLDADEEVTPILRKELISLFEGRKLVYPAYKVSIRNLLPGRKKTNFLSPSCKQIRLYQRSRAEFKNSPVHDSVVLKNAKDKWGVLRGHIEHRCFLDYQHWLSKVNRYTTMQAKDWVNRRASPPSAIRILIEPFFAFFKSYVLKRYLFLGLDGWIASFIYVHSKMLRLAKVRELYALKKYEQKQSTRTQ